MADDEKTDETTSDDVESEAVTDNTPDEPNSDPAATEGAPETNDDGPETDSGTDVPDDVPQAGDGGFSPHHSESFRNTVTTYHEIRDECPACGTADGIRQDSLVCDSCGAHFDESPNPA